MLAQQAQDSAIRGSSILSRCMEEVDIADTVTSNNLVTGPPLPVTLSISVADSAASSAGGAAVSRDLIARAVGVDSSFSVSLLLPLKLPTIALIDVEAAEDFVSNLLPKMYIEVDFNWEFGVLPRLKMMDIT